MLKKSDILTDIRFFCLSLHNIIIFNLWPTRARHDKRPKKLES